ncbi:MAG: DUF1738 domain-containing protein, partial [Oligoflexia bacterium]|nr:DUF1738 domain-containing protein [Oligoflexia bacterium]
FLQVSELGGRIKKNEHATPIVFWKIFEKQNSGEEKNEIEKMPLLRYYSVFNADQIEGIDFPEEVSDKKLFTPIEKKSRGVLGQYQKSWP